MAIELTEIPKAKTGSISQEPQLILEIEGIDTIYGIGIIKKYIKVGDPGLEVGNDWVIGGYNAVDNQEDLISFEGTTTSIAQQLLQDKGGVSSISAIQISLIDKDNKATELVSPGIVLPEILGVRANVYLGYQDTAFPQDFVQIFSGVIDEVDAGPTVVLNIAHPEAKKRINIFEKTSTTLTATANYRSALIQSIKYQTRGDVLGTVTVEYTSGATAGFEIVTVVGNAITIQIASGVSTASQIRNKIEQSIAALSLINIKIVTNGASVAQTATGGPISLGSDTTITVDSTDGFLLPADSPTLKTYIRINDELIEYTGKTATTFTGCTRAAFADQDARTAGSQHEIDDEVSSWYRLQGGALDLALKILLSGENEYFKTDVEITNFQDIPDVGIVTNSIYFEGINVADKFGLVSGDFITTTADVNAANNVSLKQISTVVKTTFGSYITVDAVSFVTSVNSTGTISFKSKYNVLPVGAGCGLGGDEVDVPEFERLQTLYFSSILDYDFYLKDSVVAKDFIDTQIMYPTGAFSIPRKGKISAGYTAPPLAISEIPALDSSNTVKPEQNRMKRSINRYFYNAIAHRYNDDLLDDDKYLTNDLLASTESKQKIKVGSKPMIVSAKGLRPSTDTDTKIDILQRRLNERYKFAAEFTSAKVFYGDAFSVDVGDVVSYGDTDLKLVDTRSGTRGFEQRLFEITNKTLNIKDGSVVLQMVDTNYLSDARYGVFGPSSIVGSGSTTTSIKITNSFGVVLPAIEKTKWEPYIGQFVRIHNDDWTFDETVTLTGFDPADNFRMLVDPALPSAPLADYTVDMPEYPTGANDFGAPYRNAHCFFDPQLAVTSGTSSTVFDVSLLDAAKLFVGAKVIVHNEDWTVVSPEVAVDSVVGTVVTVDADLGFTPSSSEFVELVGFVDDSGIPYRWL